MSTQDPRAEPVSLTPGEATEAKIHSEAVALLRDEIYRKLVAQEKRNADQVTEFAGKHARHAEGQARLELVVGRCLELAEGVDKALGHDADDTRGTKSTGLYLKIERLSRVSLHEGGDDQGLQKQIEAVYQFAAGGFEGLKPITDHLTKAIGVPENVALGVKGSGLVHEVSKLTSIRTVAVVAIGTFLAGGGAAVAIAHFIGAHL